MEPQKDSIPSLPAGPYFGTVVHGLHNGEGLGFPTANVQLSGNAVIAKGAYAVWAYVDGKRFGGMMYVGTRPTLGLTELTYEINLFDFTGDLYGQEISFVIVSKLRNEQHFANRDALSKQLEKDRALAAFLLSLHFKTTPL